MINSLQTEPNTSYLKKLGYTQWNELQIGAYDAWQKCENVCVLAPTGSGKSAAFILSILSQISNNESLTKAIIIAPTRELVIQIASVFQRFQSQLKVTSLYGGHQLSIERNQLVETPDIIVATPGRLEDHFRRGHIQLAQQLQFVVDEYDQCLSLGFQETIENIQTFLPTTTRLFFTSATQLNQIDRLFKNKPFELLDFRPETSSIEINHYKVQLTETKEDTLLHLLGQIKPGPTILFCNLRDEVEHVHELLTAYKIPNQPFHGGMEQDQRERALIQFRHGSCYFLVCTDLGSRGLDIPDVQHIIHYQLPDKAESFIHRIGRTARQGKSGNSYFFSSDVSDETTFLPQSTFYKLNDAVYLPKTPEWTTLYISGGKRDKLNKVDLVGFFCQQGGLVKDQIGQITVRDHSSYVALKTKQVKEVLQRIQGLKLKGKKYRIAYSR